MNDPEPESPSASPPPDLALAPIPSRESQRLRQLEALDVFDTPPEPFSDSVAMAAAAIASTPIAAISLVGHDRLWLKALYGGEGEEGREARKGRSIPRDHAICAHTVAASGPLLVPDATKDPRFATNPLVVGAPFLRFYAGVPILVGGEPIGALCVIDDLPRNLDDGQIERLQQLADGVAAWLSLRARPPRRSS